MSIKRLVIPLGLFFIAVGIFRLINPNFYLFLLPYGLPYGIDLVRFGGALELFGGIGILIPATRRFASYVLIALMFALLPANTYMALSNHNLPTVPAVFIWLRIPLQMILIALVWWSTLDRHKLSR